MTAAVQQEQETAAAQVLVTVAAQELETAAAQVPWIAAAEEQEATAAQDPGSGLGISQSTDWELGTGVGWVANWEPGAGEILATANSPTKGVERC